MICMRCPLLSQQTNGPPRSLLSDNYKSTAVARSVGADGLRPSTPLQTTIIDVLLSVFIYSDVVAVPP